MAKKKATKNKPVSVSLDRKWEIQNAVDTLIRADEIKKNKKLMVSVKKEAARQKKILAKIK